MTPTMPRDNALELSQVAAATATQHDSQSATDDDVLFAFLQTVDQDSRDRTQPHTGSNNDNFDSVVDEARPRTARGNTASSGSSSGADAGEESDLSTVHGHEPGGRGRRTALSVANSQSISRPKSATSAKGGMRSTDVRAPSSTGARRRLGTGDSSRSNHSSSGTRPVTAVGDAVKPFGHGILVSTRRPSRAELLREEDQEEAEPVLGSVIQAQYAKLAAQAQMPLDPPY